MKAPKHGTQAKAAQAARRSAEGPVTSKAHDPVAAPPRPTLKPAPPVSDCLKCSKIAAVNRENTRLRRLVEKLEAEEQVRLEAAAAGIDGCLTDEEIEAAKKRVLHPLFEQVLQVAVNVALSPAEEASDRLKAVMIVKDEVAGKVTEKHHLSGKVETGPVMFVSGLPDGIHAAPAQAAAAPEVTP